MNIIFDIDGTITDFEKFVLKRATPYIKKKYGIDATNLDGYDIDQVFELEKKYQELGTSPELAKAYSDKVMNRFWEANYLAYVFAPFKKGAKETVDRLIKENVDIEFCSSRKKSTQKDFKGRFVRNTIKLQLLLNLGRRHKVNFFEDEESKMNYILSKESIIIVDDKPELLKMIDSYETIDGVCINASYNKEENFNLPNKIHRVNGYENYEAYDVIKKLNDEKKLRLVR